MEENNEKLSLLFVDDERNILSSLKRLFRGEEYEIHIANSGKEGLEVLEKSDVNLVISDMRMPEMNGAEFLEEVANRWPSTVRILLTGYSEISSTIDAINKGNIYKYISKPWEDNDLKLTVRNALESKKIEQERDHLLEISRKQNEELKQFNTNLENMVEARTAELSQTMDMLEAAYGTLKESYSTVIKVFSSIIEMREGTLKGSSKRVAETARKLALKCGMSEDDARQVSFAGMLKDLGKIALPENVLNKPVSALSPDGKREFAKHTVIGEGILMNIEPLKMVAKTIRSYRERYDGKGYPDKLSKDDIPLSSKILSLVSDYYSLQTGSLIENRMSASQAREIIEKNRATRYDPVVVDQFLELTKNDKTDEEIKKQDVVMISAKDLKQNMVLARDLLTNDGVLLLSEGHRFGENMIRQVNKLESSLNEELVIYVRT